MPLNWASQILGSTLFQEWGGQGAGGPETRRTLIWGQGPLSPGLQVGLVLAFVSERDRKEMGCCESGAYLEKRQKHRK